MNRVIALDGPSGSGKSSVSREVGKRLGFLHVDSGSLYRLVTWRARIAGVDTSDEAAMNAFVKTFSIRREVRDMRVVFGIDGVAEAELCHALRTDDVNAHVSDVSRMPEVRTFVTDFLRGLRELGDLIVEGRDICTVVFPDTPARFYLDADVEVRAQRRHLEEIEKGLRAADTNEQARVKASLQARDNIDSKRACAPLRVADGALKIDSSNMTLAEVIAAVVEGLPAGWKK